jgi:hypothetical protein
MIGVTDSKEGKMLKFKALRPLLSMVMPRYRTRPRRVSSDLRRRQRVEERLPF